MTRPECYSDKVCLAPMVRGSELAYRMIIRAHGIRTCYSPMLRADEVVKAYHKISMDINEQPSASLEIRDLVRHEDGILLLEDIAQDPKPVIVQLCGNSPSVLAEATKILLELNDGKGPIMNWLKTIKPKCSHPSIEGVDLNLGCPQRCAQIGQFGAFLAETKPDLAVECIAAMRQSMDQYSKTLLGTECAQSSTLPQLSCKMRLLDSNEGTMEFVNRLVRAGIEKVAVHCRRRLDKNNGPPDLMGGAALINNLGGKIPVVINGGVDSREMVHSVLEKTQASSVMIATGFLSNPRLLEEPVADPASLAAEYLEQCEKYPPPSFLYIQKHLRWIFRKYLEPRDKSNVSYQTDWRPRLWTFLVRPYLETLAQFRQLVVLYINLSGDGEKQLPPYLENEPRNPTFKSIRHHPSRTKQTTKRRGPRKSSTQDREETLSVKKAKLQTGESITPCA